MKTKIYTIISFLMLFCFISCSNILSEKGEATSEEVSVSFSFGYNRAIISIAPENYKYTLQGTFAGETKEFCKKLSYKDFLQKTYDVKCGEWLFEIILLQPVQQPLVDGRTNTIQIITNDFHLFSCFLFLVSCFLF